MEIDSTSKTSKVENTSAVNKLKKEMEIQLKEGADKVRREVVSLRQDREEKRKHKEQRKKKRRRRKVKKVIFGDIMPQNHPNMWGRSEKRNLKSFREEWMRLGTHT